VAAEGESWFLWNLEKVQTPRGHVFLGVNLLVDVVDVPYKSSFLCPSISVYLPLMPLEKESSPSLSNELQPASTTDKSRQDGTRLLERLNPALMLENSGSVARDHLASERTFLSYVRTSSTIATTGIGK